MLRFVPRERCPRCDSDAHLFDLNEDVPDIPVPWANVKLPFRAAGAIVGAVVSLAVWFVAALGPAYGFAVLADQTDGVLELLCVLGIIVIGLVCFLAVSGLAIYGVPLVARLGWEGIDHIWPDGIDVTAHAEGEAPDDPDRRTLTGTVEPIEPIESPVWKKQCVVAAVRARGSAGDHADAVVVPFELVVDDDRRVRVEPGPGTIVEITVGHPSLRRTTPALTAFLSRHGAFPKRRRVLVSERNIVNGDRVEISGRLESFVDQTAGYRGETREVVRHHAESPLVIRFA